MVPKCRGCGKTPDQIDAVFVAGCRVHYAQICLTKPGAKDILCVGVK